MVGWFVYVINCFEFVLLTLIGLLLGCLLLFADVVCLVAVDDFDCLILITFLIVKLVLVYFGIYLIVTCYNCGLFVLIAFAIVVNCILC